MPLLVTGTMRVSVTLMGASALVAFWNSGPHAWQIAACGQSGASIDSFVATTIASHASRSNPVCGASTSRSLYSGLYGNRTTLASASPSCPAFTSAPHRSRLATSTTPVLIPSLSLCPIKFHVSLCMFPHLPLPYHQCVCLITDVPNQNDVNALRHSKKKTQQKVPEFLFF